MSEPSTDTYAAGGGGTNACSAMISELFSSAATLKSTCAASDFHDMKSTSGLQVVRDAQPHKPIPPMTYRRKILAQE